MAVDKEKKNRDENDQDSLIDFVIFGYEKCATSFLYASFLNSSSYTFVAPGERHYLQKSDSEFVEGMSYFQSLKDSQQRGVDNHDKEARNQLEKKEEVYTENNGDNSAAKNISANSAIVPPSSMAVDKEKKNRDENDQDSLIDFVIFGYEKCATSFLYASFLNSSSYTFVAPGERHYLQKSDSEFVEGMSYFQSLKDSQQRGVDNHDKEALKLSIKNGYKNPIGIYSTKALSRIENYFPDLKIVITMRHPIHWFESFYNFREQAFRTQYRKHPETPRKHLPPSHELIGSNNCVLGHGVCTERANFHIPLSNFRWTSMQSQHELELLNHHEQSSLNFNNTNVELFLIEQSQLYDSNITRAQQMENDMTSFLGLSQGSDQRLSLQTEVRTNHGSNIKAINDICDSEHAKVREELVRVGTKASEWIKTYFLASSRVTVSSKSYFLELIEKWKYDPCLFV